MRIAVVGATGEVGSHAVAALGRTSHEVVRISRSSGVDLRSLSSLLQALAGVDAVIDASNIRSQDEEEIVDFFGTTSQNLLETEHQVGVRHHVLLSIVGLDNGQRVAHYTGKREQERLVTSGPVPWSIVRSTQFHEFPAMLADAVERDGVAAVAPLLLQPIAASDAGEILAEVATGAPLTAKLEIAGPETQDLVDMARRTFATRGRPIKLVPTWRGVFDTSMAGEVLLPGPGARIAPTTFEEWLRAGAEKPELP